VRRQAALSERDHGRFDHHQLPASAAGCERSALLLAVVLSLLALLYFVPGLLMRTEGNVSRAILLRIGRGVSS